MNLQILTFCYIFFIVTHFPVILHSFFPGGSGQVPGAMEQGDGIHGRNERRWREKSAIKEKRRKRIPAAAGRSRDSVVFCVLPSGRQFFEHFRSFCPEEAVEQKRSHKKCGKYEAQKDICRQSDSFEDEEIEKNRKDHGACRQNE